MLEVSGSFLGWSIIHVTSHNIILIAIAGCHTHFIFSPLWSLPGDITNLLGWKLFLLITRETKILFKGHQLISSYMYYPFQLEAIGPSLPALICITLFSWQLFRLIAIDTEYILILLH